MILWSFIAGFVMIMDVENDDSVIILRSRSDDGVMMYVESNGFVISLWWVCNEFK